MRTISRASCGLEGSLDCVCMSAFPWFPEQIQRFLHPEVLLEAEGGCLWHKYNVSLGWCDRSSSQAGGGSMSRLCHAGLSMSGLSQRCPTLTGRFLLWVSLLEGISSFA